MWWDRGPLCPATSSRCNLAPSCHRVKKGENSFLDLAVELGSTAASPCQLPAPRRGHQPGSARTQGVCSEKALLFAASGLCSLDANVTGLPGTDINPDTHKLL